MTLYTIKPHQDHFVVSVFDGDKEPSNQYHVWANGKTFCTCPGYPKTPGVKHKHVQLVRTWQAAGEPWFAGLEISPDKSIKIYSNYQPKKV